MHAPYTAVVRGYMLQCCTIGADKQLKAQKTGQKYLQLVLTQNAVGSCADAWVPFLSIFNLDEQR